MGFQRALEELARNNLRLVTLKEQYISAACPFHKEGQERRPSFWINRDHGGWGCFACPERGADPQRLFTRLGVPALIVERLLEEGVRQTRLEAEAERAQRALRARDEFRGEHVLPDHVLGVWDYCPRALLDAGFDQQLLRTHDVGFDRERQRITFPLRDLYGQLVGISGRSVDGAEPKYLIYRGRTTIEGRQRDNELGSWFPDYSNEGVRNHLWRSHLVHQRVEQGLTERLIVVEGYKACLWLVQNGHLDTLALIGSRMTRVQERVIRKFARPVWLLLDNNEAGRTGTKSIVERIGDMLSGVWACSYPQGFGEEAQPDDLTTEGIAHVLTNAQRVIGGSFERRIRQLSSAAKRPRFQS